MNNDNKKNRNVNARLIYSGIIYLLVLLSVFMRFASNAFAQNDAEAWFQRGIQAVDLTEKIANFTKATELNPFFIEAYYNLGLIYNKQGFYNKASEQFRLALGSNPEGVHDEFGLRVLYELGITYKKLNRYTEAKTTLQRASNLSTEIKLRANIYYELGMINVLLKKFDDAIAQFNMGIKMFPDQTERFNKAIALVQNKKLTKTYYKQGLSYVKIGKYTEAIKTFKKVQKYDPEYEGVSKQIKQAQKKLRQVIKQTISDSALYAQALSEFNHKNYDEAIELFEQIISVSPEYKDVHTRLAEAKKAQKRIKYLPELDKYYEQGNQALDRKDWLKAYTAYKKVMSIDPNYKLVARNIRLAKAELSKNSKKQPRKSKMTLVKKYYDEAIKAYKNENWIKAATIFQILADLYPKYKDTKLRLVEVKKYIAQDEKEKRHFMDEELRRRSVELYFEKGLVNLERRDWVQAVIDFEKVKVLNPNYPELQEKLVLARSKIKEAVGGAFEAQLADPKSSHSSSSWPIFFMVLIITGGLIAGIFYVHPSARARFSIIKGNFDNARVIYEEMLTKKPNNMKLHSMLANIYLLENRKDETAIRVYETVLRQKINTQRNEDIESILKEYYKNRQNEKGKKVNVLDEALSSS